MEDVGLEDQQLRIRAVLAEVDVDRDREVEGDDRRSGRDDDLGEGARPAARLDDRLARQFLRPARRPKEAVAVEREAVVPVVERLREALPLLAEAPRVVRGVDEARDRAPDRPRPRALGTAQRPLDDPRLRARRDLRDLERAAALGTSEVDEVFRAHEEFGRAPRGGAAGRADRGADDSRRRRRARILEPSDPRAGLWPA